jgi:hypothetical protein
MTCDSGQDIFRIAMGRHGLMRASGNCAIRDSCSCCGSLFIPLAEVKLGVAAEPDENERTDSPSTILLEVSTRGEDIS